MEKTCMRCGATFQTYNSNRKYCGRSCFFETTRTRSGWRKCELCGEDFYFRWRGNHKHEGRYCSVVCANKGRMGPRPQQSGELHPGWKGGRHVRERDQYVSVYVPGKDGQRGKRMLEHRLVMAEHLGRELRPNETVHHKNGVRSDNRLENLELRVGKHGKGQTVEDLVAHAREILELYG